MNPDERQRDELLVSSEKCVLVRNSLRFVALDEELQVNDSSDESQITELLYERFLEATK